MQHKIAAIALLSLCIGTASADMPKATHRINNLNVYKVVSPKGNVSYWMVEKAAYNPRTDEVNLKELREDENGKIIQSVSYDSPCEHRKFMKLETTTDDPFGPAPKTQEWWSSGRKFAHTPESLQMTDALCPKK